MADVTMRQMLEAGVHFGHQTRYWSPKMRPYIYGERNKIYIINLEHTLPLFKDAMQFLKQMAVNGGNVLFVGTKRPASKVVREEAERCGCPYVNHRWLGGMLTNFKTVKNSIQRLKDLDIQVADGELDKLSKKEALQLQRERDKLERSLSGIKEMGGLPDALFVIDVKQEYIAVSEAKKLKIPVVAVVDTNCEPDSVDYVIPGNDDAIRAIRLYANNAADAILEGRQIAKDTLVPQAGEYIEVDESGQAMASDYAETLTERATPEVVQSAEIDSGLSEEEEPPTEEAAEPAAEKLSAVVEEDAGLQEVPVEATKETTTKAVAKKAVAKKTVAKKTGVKKTAAKKTLSRKKVIKRSASKKTNTAGDDKKDDGNDDVAQSKADSAKNVET